MKKYSVTFENELVDKRQLFERITDVVKLGYSRIENWNAFRELMFENLEHRDIQIDIIHNSKLNLSARDVEIYLDLQSELLLEFEDKIQFNLKG